MEIKDNDIKESELFLFKIDLIVWKLCFYWTCACPVIQFKIDLIVWKCKSIDPDLAKGNAFKIDLIVWKFS